MGSDLRYQNESGSTLLSYADDLYDDLTRRIREAHPAGAGISHSGWLAPRGSIGKEIDHGN